MRARPGGRRTGGGHLVRAHPGNAARRRGEGFDRLCYATAEALPLSPRPYWKDLPEDKRRRLIDKLVAEGEAEAATRREQSGILVLGVDAVLAQQALASPKRSKKSPEPLFHAATKAVRQGLYEAYGWFVAAYREAAEKLRGGDRTVIFPVGSFPPALPFATG